jgi:hypothetical protein
MTFIEFLRGVGWVFFIMIVAGGVAYVGDRVGHQVGRKRLTLFGIRPRYTSTIVAVGTGMLIAFLITVVAIGASHNVQTAFFTLNRLNQQISDLQQRQLELEKKVTTGRLVVATDTVMVPFYGFIPQNEPTDDRLKRVRAYYDSAVRYMNNSLTRFGLRPYSSPPDLDHRLEIVYDSPAMTALLSQSNVILLVTADQNLYENDPIHFQLQPLPDTRRFAKGQVIAALNIPVIHNANPTIAVSELTNYIANAARAAQLPNYLATNVVTVQVIPSPQQMVSMLSHGSGPYVMTAFAAEDIYPHTGGIPVDITLSPER